MFALAAMMSAAAGAQENKVNVDSKEPAPPPATDKSSDEKNVFQNLKIELLDLDRLREEVGQKLVGEPVRMTVDQCVQTALKSNQDILIAGYGIAMSDADLMAARGDFDPSLQLSAQHTDTGRPASAQIKNFSGGLVSDILSRQQDYQLALRGLTWVGTQYSFGFNVNRERSTFIRDPVTGAPLTNYTADWTLSLTQPLLRGMGTKPNLVRLKRAKNNQKISDAQAELALINAIGQVVNSYWDLVGAVEQLRVRQQALDNALRVLRINEQRFELGTAAQLEVFVAKAAVASRQSDLVSARTIVLDAEDVLKVRMGMRDESGDLLSGANIVPTDRPLIRDPEYDLKQSMRTAIERRPDVISAQLAIDNAELDLKASRNGLFPQLDLSASYGRNALELEGSDIFHGLQDENHRTWTVGAVASVPLGNRTARGNYQRNKLFLRREEQLLMKTKDDVMLGVRVAIHALVSNRILVESTRYARLLEEANVTAEEKRLVIGVATAQDVLLKQEDLTAAQAREVRAQVDFERSQIELQVAEGTLLEKMNIVYDAPDYGSAPGFFESLGRIDTND
jgi:outer membrane protein TolC